jgi:hypothetical protein
MGHYTNGQSKPQVYSARLKAAGTSTIATPLPVITIIIHVIQFSHYRL